jgi:hypothetical protein
MEKGLKPKAELQRSAGVGLAISMQRQQLTDSKERTTPGRELSKAET